MTIKVLVGDVRERLAEIPPASVHCVVTSPPYYNLRDYGVVGQIGLEATLAEYLAVMVDVFREVRRVMRDDATLWLNIGDSYSGAGYGNHDVNGPVWKDAAGLDRRSDRQQSRKKSDALIGLKPKDLMMVPARLAMALQEPYYTGRIKNEIDRVWLAAMIDAEGCLFIHKRKIGQNNGQGYERKSDTFS